MTHENGSDTSPATNDIAQASNDEEQVRKDVSYSPASERETEERQKSPRQSAATDDVDQDAVETLPGTGGPDDNGEVVVPDADLNIPRDSGAH
jgi:hypothetical protein